MQPKQVLLSLSALYIGGTLIFGAWALRTWSASEPQLTLAVQGVSTEATAAAEKAVSLAPYPSPAGPPSIQAKEYVLFEPKSGKVIFRSKTLDPVPIASTTKLMTTHLTALHGKMDDIVTVSPEAAGQIGSVMGLQSGERITVENLLYGTLLVSGNDGAKALSEYVGGLLLHNPQATPAEKTARFVTEMNDEAGRLLMIGTHYKDPAGLNDEGHSTAFDLAKIATVVDSQEELRKIIGTALTTVYDTDYRIRHDLRNSNRLVADYQYEGIVGGKTGYTPDAGHCLVSTASRGNITLTAVILHTNDENSTEASAREAQKLLDAGFSSVDWQ